MNQPPTLHLQRHQRLEKQKPSEKLFLLHQHLPQNPHPVSDDTKLGTLRLGDPTQE
jgi:hypothetical protein